MLFPDAKTGVLMKLLPLYSLPLFLFFFIFLREIPVHCKEVSAREISFFFRQKRQICYKCYFKELSVASAGLLNKMSLSIDFAAYPYSDDYKVQKMPMLPSSTAEAKVLLFGYKSVILQETKTALLVENCFYFKGF